MSTLNASQPTGLASSTIRGEGATKQSNKLNLGHTSMSTAAPVQPAQAPVSAPIVVEKKVYVDVDSVEEKNIIAEAFAKMALLIMENKRLRSRLNTRQQELSRL